MLELIDGDAIGQELRWIPLSGLIAVLLSGSSKKRFIHGSAKNSIDIESISQLSIVGATILGDLDVAGHIGLEAMAEFVGQDIDVTRGAVEVGEDDRAFMNREIGHIAARSACRAWLRGRARMVIDHEVKEIIGFGERSSYIAWAWATFSSVVPKGSGVAILEGEGHIVDLRLLDAGALELRF
jgi:hypothetical protein